MFTFLGLYIWNKRIRDEDLRKMDLMLESDRNLLLEINKENKEISQQIRDETQQMITAIHEDIKDFHGRLCAIEERNRGKS